MGCSVQAVCQLGPVGDFESYSFVVSAAASFGDDSISPAVLSALVLKPCILPPLGILCWPLVPFEAYLYMHVHSMHNTVYAEIFM